MKNFKDLYVTEQQKKSLSSTVQQIKNEIAYELNQKVKIETDYTEIPIMLDIYVKNLMTGEKTEKIMKSSIRKIMVRYSNFNYNIYDIKDYKNTQSVEIYQ